MSATINARVMVEKKIGFQVEANELLQQLKDNFQIKATACRLINIYDIFNINEDLLFKSKKTVFSEVVVDNVLDNLDLDGKSYLAWEYIPGQYDQRGDSAVQCLQLLDSTTTATVKSGQIILLENSNQAEINKIKEYLINPIEARVKDLEKLEMDENVEVRPLVKWNDFNDYNENQMAEFMKSERLAMNLADAMFIQSHFKEVEKRVPTETEIKVLDTYWSDHCRHTTFATHLENIIFEKSSLSEQIEDAYKEYVGMRENLGRNHKPETLMDMATINARYLTSQGKLLDVEVSSEINACSIFVDVDHDGQLEKWLVMFKNETHNHPTEIEPFGGASTCIGGAIRDPLSGRSYVYQAMRISGCGNVWESIEDTLPNKLPQKVISKKATLGNSSYGNQIGLATTHVKEVIHPSYVAKHLELGAVVGATKASNVKRLEPKTDDVIILLGGKTGRDGIGGATGSSKEHDDKSLATCATEVQKGNAPEERKIQRLFRNPEVATLIKKCNDFGAGGICVAIGELADGLLIELDKVKTKYEGLNATELAISESQERMAVVVNAKNADLFIELAKQENLEAYVVGKVTAEPRLIMKMHGVEVVNISREFIDSNGVAQTNDAIITNNLGNDPFTDIALTEDNILKMLRSPNVACQKGISENFDASIGSTTVLMPFGGRRQLTPSQASVQKIPVLDGKTTTCSILTHGFNPDIFEYSPFIGAMMSVLESMSKTVAVGGDLDNLYFSFQEYFERLNKEPERWGKVVQALLGATKVLSHFEKAAIGGKDSMSGSFNELDVIPTLVSFACSTASTKNIVSSHLKTIGNKLVVLKPVIRENGYPDLGSYQEIYKIVEEQIRAKNVVSSYVVEQGGILSACFKMSFGNEKGFRIDSNLGLLKLIPGAIVVECSELIASEYAHLLGEVTDKDYEINDLKLDHKTVLNTWLRPYNELYPMYVDESESDLPIIDYVTDKKFKSKNPTKKVKVLIPVFPGTNCEYDMARAFEDQGATVEILVFKNYEPQAIQNSLTQLANSLNNSHILALAGGFSSGDEPDGSAKFIVNVLQNPLIKKAITNLLKRDGLIIGICNGFQALLKSGLLINGEVTTVSADSPTLFKNNINRHISTIASTRVSSNNSPWLQELNVGEIHQIAMSHGEGKFVASEEVLTELVANGQIAFQYASDDGVPTLNGHFNPNGSSLAIEGITSKCGRILGKMGHSERYLEGVFQNIDGNKEQNIFASGVNYFKL